jgi:hypothetical protein
MQMAGRREAWTYDGKGRVDLHVDRRGVAADWNHDALGRPVLVNYPFGGSPLTSIVRAFDGAFRPLIVADTAAGVREPPAGKSPSR